MAARLTKPLARLTVVRGNRQHWGRRLDKFRVKYALSVRDLVGVVDGVLKKSAIDDLLSGESNPRMDAIIKPTIATHLRRFLRARKKSNLEIEREMLAIFYEPVCKEIEQVITQRTPLPKSVQRDFGLNRDPFPNEPPRSPAERFTTPSLDKIAVQLEEAINFQGFVCVLGDRGSGKSFMRRATDEACRSSKGMMRLLWPDFPNMEKVHSGSIAAFILREFEQKVPHDLVYRASRLKKLLAGLSDKEIRVALGFDECHRLDPRLLTALKNFWELGSGGYDRYLGLILFGQPQFKTTLLDSDFWEITERLNVIDMPDMSDHAWSYIAHRIRLAGGSAEKLFERAAVTKLAKISATPLGLGNLANAALLKAHSFSQRKVLASMIDAGNEPKVRAARMS